jgi:hypothetical protein
MPDVPRVGPGIYINMFGVTLHTETISMLAYGADRVSDYDELRTELEAEGITFLYREGKKIYGYGTNPQILFERGFEENIVNLSEFPHLTSRMITQGFIDKVTPEYNVIESKGRVELVSKRKCATLLEGRVSMYRVYDTRCVFLKDHDSRSIEFGLVIDTNFKLKDQNGESLNSSKIKQNFGSGALAEIRRFQGDLVPGGKINTEVSRQRLLEEIIPFVEKNSIITLPGKIIATINTEPMHVVLGGD